MKLSRATIALYVGLVFASGLALGVYGDKYYAAKVAEEKQKTRKRPPTPEEWRKQTLSIWQKQFLLTDTQVTQINAVLDETRSLTDETNRRHRPEFEEIQRQNREKIRAILTEDQRAKFDAFRPPKGSRPKSKPDGGR